MNANETKEKLTSTSAYIVQRTVTYTYTDVYICNIFNKQKHLKNFRVFSRNFAKNTFSKNFEN